MNLMKFRKYSMLLALAALSLTGCQDDLSADGNLVKEPGKYVYVHAAIALPSTAGTRSGTDDTVTGSGKDQTNSDVDKGENGQNGQNDFEYGHAYENEVRSMLLVIADKDDKYITHTVVSGFTATPSSTPPLLSI